MATVWIYPPEILPLKTRAKGASLAAAADFLGNFLVVEITPPALKNIGYKTYIIFAVLNIANAIIVWAFYPETSGQTLESVDKMFVAKWDDDELAGTKDPVWRRAQWSVVRKAHALRNNRAERTSEEELFDEGTDQASKGHVAEVEGPRGQSSA